MNKVYALLAGIDVYAAAPRLRGCRADAVAALAYLASRTAPADLHPLELHDEKATREAIIDGIRDHLGGAGPGDTAIFWYAGHGSHVQVPRELSYSEAGGRMQTLVCADSRTGDVPDLYDKELAVLLDQVAARGAHVAVVLDSCHSAGAVRGEVPEAAARARRVAPADRAFRPGDLIPELRHGWAALPEHSRVVALAACRSDQVATELPLDGSQQRGVFSWALLRALNQLGPYATYRELLAAARCSVQDKVQLQSPQLAGDEPADQPFLGGALRRPASTITMRYLRGPFAAGHWEIDAGACHGVLPGPSVVTVAGDGPVRTARVTSVQVDRCLVDPDGWTPDPGRQYPVVFTQLPRPALTVAVDGPADVAAEVDASAFLRVVRPDETVVPDLRFRVTDQVRILGTDGRELAQVAAEYAVRAGERIARWRQVRALTNPGSRLGGGVRLEIVTADGSPVREGDDGVIRLRYRWESGRWVAPTVFVRLRNTTDRPLYCVLLDLTGRYRIHAELFRGEFVAARYTGGALNGRPVEFSLPGGEAVTPGARVRDWLKLVVAEQEFGSRPFEQDGLGGADRRGVLPKVAMTRDAGPGGAGDAFDWTASVVEVLTEVPR